MKRFDERFQKLQKALQDDDENVLKEMFHESSNRREKLEK